MRIARVRGARRQVRRQLAQVARDLLARHRIEQPHQIDECPLCLALLGDPLSSGQPAGLSATGAARGPHGVNGKHA